MADPSCVRGGGWPSPRLEKFRANSVFRASSSCSKILKNMKNISKQWKISGQILFFRASAYYSKFWRIKNTFNTVNSGHTLLFSARKSCSNILNVKSILNTAKNWMTNFVFRASASSSKILKDKNISKQWKIAGQTLFFRACASCSKFWMIENINIQYNEFRGPSVFQGKPQVAQKSWKIKNISTSWRISWQHCFTEQESCSKIWMIKN